MSAYSVTYKRERGPVKTIRHVKGDGLVEGGTHRFFICTDETRYEVPIAGTEFKFSKERFLVIKQNMERTVGQTLPVQV